MPKEAALHNLPSVTVVVPAFNASMFLDRAVESVFATEYPGVEVVIVDDGSTDNTFEIAERLARLHLGRCRVLRHPDGQNHGVSAARNLGISNCQSEWIAFLDADDTYRSNRFDLLGNPAAKLNLEGELVCIEAVDAYYELASVQVDCSAEEDARWGSNPGSIFGIGVALDRENLLSEIMHSRTWAVSAITVRRPAILSVGMFSSEIRIAEDCHLWVRLVALKRVAAGQLLEPCAIYYRHGNNSFALTAPNRVLFLQAMLDAYRIVEAAKPGARILKRMQHAIRLYVRRMLFNTEDTGRAAMAWRVFRLAISTPHYRICSEPVLIRSLVGGAFSRLGGARILSKRAIRRGRVERSKG